MVCVFLILNEKATCDMSGKKSVQNEQGTVLETWVQGGRHDLVLKAMTGTLRFCFLLCHRLCDLGEVT